MKKHYAINAGSPPKYGHVPVEDGRVSEPKCWTFSFRHWQQISNFGFADAGLDLGWFVSLLDQLKALSSETVDDIRRGKDTRKADVLRYHPIVWKQPGIPLQRSDFLWLPEDILGNEIEFPFFQFCISTGTGRIVGYWDQDDLFYVLLLDPLHNIQPSKKFNYRVDPCNPMRNQFEKLSHAITCLIQDVEAGCVAKADCPVKDKMNQVLVGSNTAMVITLGDEHWLEARNLLKSGAITSIDDIWAFGLLMAADYPEKLRELTSK